MKVLVLISDLTVFEVISTRVAKSLQEIEFAYVENERQVRANIPDTKAVIIYSTGLETKNALAATVIAMNEIPLLWIWTVANPIKQFALSKAHAVDVKDFTKDPVSHIKKLLKL